MNRRRSEGASQSRARMADQYRGWVRHHRLSAADSLARVVDKPLASVMTWLVIGIALALPVALDVALDNAGALADGWDSPTQISLFLNDDVDDAQGRELAQGLAEDGDVAAARFVSREEALAEFTALSGFADVLASLDDNPLPSLVLVEPAVGLDGGATGELRQRLAAQPAVAEAVLDMEWLQRLNSLMALAQRLVLAVGALLVLGVVLILGNTIRLAIENRRDEIVIVKLVGGSNAFVRRPFLYTGLWFGVGGGAAAALLVSAALWYLDAPVAELAALYGSDFSLGGLGLMGALNLVLLGGALGLAGAWLAVTRHLADIVPQ